MKSRLKIACRGLLLASCFISTFARADVWYVDRDNTSHAQNGRSWTTAFRTIQPAINAAQNNPDAEIWIAEGTYDEARTYLVDGVNTGALLMRDGTKLYGGFAGNETARDQRNTLRHRSVIDGSKARDGERAIYVVVGASHICLDGLTITGSGFVDGQSTNAINLLQWPEFLTDVQILGCEVTDNFASGAAVLAPNVEDLVISRCLVARNQSGNGAPALYATGYFTTTQPKIVDTTVSENDIGPSFTNIINRCSLSTGEVTRCVFSRNLGTPLELELRPNQPGLTDCDFIDNQGGMGGAMVYGPSDAIQPIIQGCVFQGNVGRYSTLNARGYEEDPAAGQNFTGHHFIQNSAFINNQLEFRYGGSLVQVNNANFVFDHMTFAGNNFNTAIRTGVISHGVRLSDIGDEYPAIAKNSIFWNEPTPFEFSWADAEAMGLTLAQPSDSIVRGGYADHNNYDTAPTFRDMSNGDFRLVNGSAGMNLAQPTLFSTEDIFGALRPNDEPDLGAYEIQYQFPSLCDSSAQIEERLSQFRFISDPHTDLDGDGLPEIAALRLMAAAACQYETSFGIAAEQAFAINIRVADEEPFDTQIVRRQSLIAAWMSISEAAQSTLRDALAEMDISLTGDYAIVSCEPSGECHATVLDHAARATDHGEEIYSGSGDIDHDGVSNAREWSRVAAANGTVDDFVAAAMDPSVRATGSTGSSRGGCFIATAAYGTSLSGDLNALRSLRDTRLLNNPAGAAFTDLYYRVSPPIADVIAQHDGLRAMVRAVLEPIIAAAKWMNGEKEPAAVR